MGYLEEWHCTGQKLGRAPHVRSGYPESDVQTCIHCLSKSCPTIVSSQTQSHCISRTGTTVAAGSPAAQHLWLRDRKRGDTLHSPEVSRQHRMLLERESPKSNLVALTIMPRCTCSVRSPISRLTTPVASRATLRLAALCTKMRLTTCSDSLLPICAIFG